MVVLTKGKVFDGANYGGEREKKAVHLLVHSLFILLINGIMPGLYQDLPARLLQLVCSQNFQQVHLKHWVK